MDQYAIRAGVLGASGYVGRELTLLLGRHPRVRLEVATSESEAGRPHAVAASAAAASLVRLEDARLDGCDVVFSCLPHGAGGEWVAAARSSGARVIDLSSDLRLAAGSRARAGARSARRLVAAGAMERESESEEPGSLGSPAVYGLPELFRADLPGAHLVANPGCYPTAVLVALAPLLRRRLIAGPVIVNAASGVTGAGRSPRRDLLFGEVAEDFRAYAVGNVHRHVAEMRVHGGRLSGTPPELVFTPHLLPVRRGILATIYVPLSAPLDTADPATFWREDYVGEAFVEVLPDGVPSLASAVGTNRVVVGVTAVADATSPALLVVAAMDNLLKGAAGQAVQNMNLSFGWPETEGLPC